MNNLESLLDDVFILFTRFSCSPFLPDFLHCCIFTIGVVCMTLDAMKDRDWHH